ncbi:MAG TPA: N-6 DNA methylase, partial [Thermoleophilia bacterium]|nr:N-6 DNA methylase [Thermoleophilia bacterium]
RLIFLFAAEDRDLLFPPEVPADVRERYRRFYSTSRLRSLAAHRRGTAHPDLYRGLLLVMRKLGDPAGCPELGLPALGSFLWSEEAMPNLDTSQIANHALLAAVRQLAFSEESGVRRPIDYRNLGAEELGSVYEALLELTPEINLEGKTFELKVVGGSERKKTGSYYTPSSLIQQLLDTALDPVMEEAVSKPNPQEAILELEVCDPACGSGHFLVAAAHRIARRLASLRTGDEEPSPDAQRHALRDVIRHCIYGVDINPLAVELCKVNLWLETLDPGLPLSFLDHRIVCGNSLLGTTPRLMAGGIPDEAFNPIEGDDRAFASGLKRQNRQERPKEDLREQGIASGQFSMFDRMFAHVKGLHQASSFDAASIDAMEEDTIDRLNAKQEAYEQLLRSQTYEHGKLLADAWCAAFVWRKTADSPPAPTDSVFRRLSAGAKDIPDESVSEIQRLAEAYHFLHLHLAFPGVFTVPEELGSAENDDTGWSGGFDVVLGNPPWERVKLQEKEWFAGRNDEIANAPNKAARERLIAGLQSQDPALYEAFLAAKREAEGDSHLVRNTERFPLCGRGDINTYAVFAELKRSLLSVEGRVGCIVPSGIATDDTTRFFFQDATDRRALVSLYDFENRRGLFPGVHRSYKFCLLTLTGPGRPVEVADFVFFALDVADLQEAEKHFKLTPEDMALINPNTRTCPIFRSRKDAELTKGIYRRVPVLIRAGPPENNPWEITFLRMFDMSNDSHLFHTNRQLGAEGWRLEGNVFVRNGERYLPLYEAKMVHHYDHRFGDFRDQPGGSESTVLPDVPTERKRDPEYAVCPRYWIAEQETQERLSDDEPRWLLIFRNVARATDVRTCINTIVPRIGVGNSAPVILFLANREGVYSEGLSANLSSFVFDYVTRQKVGGINFNFYIVQQLPAMAPTSYDHPSPWDRTMRLGEWCRSRILELTYTSNDLAGFAHSLGSEAQPFQWDEARRHLLRCELDAAYFHLYGMSHTDVDYVMETFPIVKQKDEDLSGEYHTKRVILEIYDEMHRAITTGMPYKTRLDPPAADPRVAHRARRVSQQ